MSTASAILLPFIASVLLAQALPIPFGSALDADQQVLESQQLAKNLVQRPCGTTWHN